MKSVSEAISKFETRITHVEKLETHIAKVEKLEKRIDLVEKLSSMPAPVRSERGDPALTAQLQQQM